MGLRKIGVLVLASCMAVAVAAAGTTADHVREAALVTYVHGMTQEIADREVGPEGVPYLLELLRDPDFPRRDNVMAFLAYLASDSEAQAIADFLESEAPDVERSADYRARLIAPEALGRIAARGGTVAQDVLGQLARAGDGDSGFARQVEYGKMLAGGGVMAPEPAQPVEPGEGAPLSADTNPTIHLHDLTYANHINTNDPMTDPEADALCAEATKVFGVESSNDTGCCIQFGSTVPGKVFGVNGDGKDVITTNSELSAVMSLSLARIKVVDYVGYCGGPGTNIIGCGLTPGNGIVLVRVSGAFMEGLLWTHEYGHNMGLGHNSNDTGWIMSPGLSPGNTRVNSSECNKYHNPSASGQAAKTATGECNDDDADKVASSTDNCPAEFNYDQADADDDNVGDVCDNCAQEPNAGQGDCDTDQVGDACDPSIFIPPAVNPIFFSSKQTLTWSANPYGKHIYRGSYSGGAWVYNDVLVATLPFQPSWNDPTVPVAGTVNYYLVKAYNNCGEGP